MEQDKNNFKQEIKNKFLNSVSKLESNEDEIKSFEKLVKLKINDKTSEFSSEQ